MKRQSKCNKYSTLLNFIRLAHNSIRFDFFMLQLSGNLSKDQSKLQIIKLDMSSMKNISDID